MDIGILPIVLFLLTLGVVIFFALRSKTKVEDRLDDPSARKSTLAVDAPSSRPGEKPVQ